METSQQSIMQYEGQRLLHTAFPLGGMGAGSVCLEGTGALNHCSLRHKPEMYNEPGVFSALYVGGMEPTARVLEGPVPPWKVFGPTRSGQGAGNGVGGAAYGLPRLLATSMTARFPFATVHFHDDRLPVDVELTGWSPFAPGDADAASLPVAALEYRFINTGSVPVDGIYSIHARNMMRSADTGHQVLSARGGFTLAQEATPEDPSAGGWCTIQADDPAAVADCRWFRGRGFDALTSLWRSVSAGRILSHDPVGAGQPSPGGSIYVPFRLEPGQEKVVRVRLSWYVPVSGLRIGYPENGDGGCCGTPAADETYVPWYAARFSDAAAVASYWEAEYEKLRAASAGFSNALFDSTLPGEALDAVAANLSILKSPTVLRQADGRLWGWEGCCDTSGCCYGSCTHVWNYAQAVCHLFPELERSLRETELTVTQDERGHQHFRTPLPIGPGSHEFHAAADGQLGGLIKLYREWRICGDLEWLRSLWPAAKQSLSYCIRTWDPKRRGVLEEPHHNTYDIEFWGPDGMCTGFYVAALRVMVDMGTALGEDVGEYETLLQRSRKAMEHELYDGEYFIQNVKWTDLAAENPAERYRRTGDGAGEPVEEVAELLDAHGPKYQYATGCISDGVLGIWMAELCGVSGILDDVKVDSHLRSVYRYNFRDSLMEHPNPQRPGFALGDEAGLLLCSWPKGGEPALPFPYSNEVWTGIEYQVAAHLIMRGMVAEGLRIVRAARDRYTGTVRNPFDEYECGHWYARAMSSYALLPALSGVRYDAVQQILTVKPRVHGDFQAFVAAAGGYGLAGVRNGKPFLDVRSGSIPVQRIDYQEWK
jgi:uncharacterized protein (DUF608 family)